VNLSILAVASANPLSRHLLGIDQIKNASNICGKKFVCQSNKRRWLNGGAQNFMLATFIDRQLL
jgi:hypothetical protein